MSLSINGVIGVSSLRWNAGWSGVWTAELVLEDLPALPGRVVITSTEGLSLIGTIDPLFSGTFGEKRRARIIGGAAGWSKIVPGQHFHTDIGVSMSEVATSTAAVVGEAVVVLVPKLFGTDYVRRVDAASQIFVDAGLDWWVGVDGVTKVGIRPPAVPPVSLEVTDWDAEAGTMSFTADVLVEPGTVLLDPRFGRRVVRSVEALVSDGSVTGTLWVVDAPASLGTVTELVEGLATLARAATRAELGRVYEYRVIAMAGDRVELQAVRSVAGIPDILPAYHPFDGLPDILPASVWAGSSGYRAVLRPASKVLVGFIAGDPTRPYLAAYEPPEGNGWRPLMLDIDAISSVEIGTQAIGVLLGGPAGADLVARSTGVLVALTAIAAYAQAVAILSPATLPAAQALTAALAPLVLTIPSKKVLAA